MSKRNPTIEDVIRLTLPIQRKMREQGCMIRFVIEFEPCAPQKSEKDCAGDQRRTKNRGAKHAGD